MCLNLMQPSLLPKVLQGFTMRHVLQTLNYYAETWPYLLDGKMIWEQNHASDRA